jgi:enoyl-CoA hydratase
MRCAWGFVQEIVPAASDALAKAILIAEQITRRGPLGIKETLASAYPAVENSEAEAYAKLDSQYRALHRTDDFIFMEGRKAEDERRLSNH